MTIAGANGGQGLKLQDFIPQWDGEAQEQTPADIVAVLKELEAKTKKKGEKDG